MMEGQVRKYGHKQQQLSPDRAKVWKERSCKYKQRQPEAVKEPKSRNVAVVYYLCKNRQLEHPHFIEVSLSSSEGLFLKDVIEKLNGLRGSGMASMYSWSCKRSYKHGFVWHDLCEDDLIIPVNGNEYVLKGSELVEESNAGGFAPSVKLQNVKQLPEPPSARSQDDSSSSSTSMSVRDAKNSQDDELSPPVRHSGSSGVSPESKGRKSTASNGGLSLTEYKIYKTDSLADASTQTEENTKANKALETCTRGVSTDDVASESLNSCVKDNSEIEINPSPPSSSSTSSSMGKAETLESLIIADASKYNNFRRLEGSQTQVNSKVKAADMLMQLISCGSISVKDHSFGLIPSYKPGLSDAKFQSPLFSTSVMLRELDCYSDNSRFTSMRLDDKEYFSGSLDSKLLKEEDTAALKRSSCYNADRTDNGNHVSDKEETATLVKCIPKSLKPSLGKNSKNVQMKSQAYEGQRISSDAGPSSRIVSPCPSNSSSKRITTDPCSSKIHSGRLESFREEKENAIQVEESLLQELRLSSTHEAVYDTEGNL